MNTSARWLLALFVTLGIADSGRSAGGQVVGREAVESSVTLIDVNTQSKQVMHRAKRRIEAPNWSPDGRYLLLNASGKLGRLPADGGQFRAIPTGNLGWIDVNHGISPDGKFLAVTAGPIFRLSASGGKPSQVTQGAPSYFHAWSPDGRTLVYAADRGRGVDLYEVAARGGQERALTVSPGIDDAADFSSDGKWIYYTSNRSGSSDIWRIPPTGGGPGDAQAERVTNDEEEDWFPHPSPDGKWLVFLSYHQGTQRHPADQDVVLRRMKLPGARVEPPKIDEIAHFVGGHGSIGARPWSPDSRRLAYVSFAQPPPKLWLVFFTPAGIMPPTGVQERMDRIADATERFFTHWMKRWDYPPARKQIFERNRDGSVEVLYVKGEYRLATGRYQKPVFAEEVISKATRLYQIAGDRHLWWIFTYFGAPPKRIDEYRGHGTSQDGGWAIVNYLSAPGEISPDGGLASGFNAKFTLKGCIHELGHAFGLPHLGPDPAKGLGNSLMGPNNPEYAASGLPNSDKVYLTEAETAMLWKHPIFSGDSHDRPLRPKVTLLNYKARFDPRKRQVAISGKLVASVRAHTAIVLDDLGKPDNEYWLRPYTGLVASDGTFQVAMDGPTAPSGHYRIVFAFENGAIAGAGDNSDYYGASVKSYKLARGGYVFGE